MKTFLGLIAVVAALVLLPSSAAQTPPAPRAPARHPNKTTASRTIAVSRARRDSRGDAPAELDLVRVGARRSSAGYVLRWTVAAAPRDTLVEMTVDSGVIATVKVYADRSQRPDAYVFDGDNQSISGLHRVGIGSRRWKGPHRLTPQTDYRRS